MSRTVRRLPTGDESKKNRKIGYYNSIRRFHPSAIHLLKAKPPAPQSKGWQVERFGLWLHKPHSFYDSDPYEYYSIDDPRQYIHSIGGPRWVDAKNFSLKWVEELINRGWTYNTRTERKWIGPEEWDYVYINHGPDFRKQLVWMINPEYDSEVADVYRDWLEVHRIVVRNGHYKDHHPGYAKWHRREKQREHQEERSRQTTEIRKLLRETSIDQFEDSVVGKLEILS